MRITHIEIGAYFTLQITNLIKPTISNIVKHPISSSEGRGTLRDGRGTWVREIGREKGRENRTGNSGGDVR